MITRVEQVSSGLSKLLEQFKGKYNTESLLSTYLKETQEIQSVYEQMLDFRSITTAVGKQLDMVGNVVGERRGNRGDDAYRLAILIRIAINTNDGTLPSIQTIVRAYTGADNIQIFEHYPASIYMYIDGGSPDSSLVDVVKSILPSGVSLGYIGYGNNDLLLIPYDQEYVLTPLGLDTGDILSSNTGNSINVTKKSSTAKIFNGYLAEFVSPPAEAYGIPSETL